MDIYSRPKTPKQLAAEYQNLNSDNIQNSVDALEIFLLFAHGLNVGSEYTMYVEIFLRRSTKSLIECFFDRELISNEYPFVLILIKEIEVVVQSLILYSNNENLKASLVENSELMDQFICDFIIVAMGNLIDYKLYSPNTN